MLTKEHTGYVENNGILGTLYKISQWEPCLSFGGRDHKSLTVRYKVERTLSLQR